LRARAEGPGRAETTEPLVEAAGRAFEEGFRHFHESFDARNGGFGGAPKFPRASNLAFLCRVAALQGGASELGAEAVRLATSTLRAMARGGIHDHVGGGFHRYSVDDGWFVPHFEKMLYDQAQIVVNCLEARQATGDERFAWLARDILGYVSRDLAAPGGGFFTAEDADSPVADAAGAITGHAEGAFYVWTPVELRAALGDDAAFAAWHFGVDEQGNVPAQLDPQGELRGRNLLVQRRGLAETARRFGLDPEAANDRLLSVLDRLRAARARRPRPHLDDKVLTSCNARMISAVGPGHPGLGPGVPGPRETNGYASH
ncbi:MAG: thioredoxin domain-containing protein, partial [Opitutaceae bacterium]